MRMDDSHNDELANYLSLDLHIRSRIWLRMLLVQTRSNCRSNWNCLRWNRPEFSGGVSGVSVHFRSLFLLTEIRDYLYFLPSTGSMTTCKQPVGMNRLRSQIQQKLLENTPKNCSKVAQKFKSCHQNLEQLRIIVTHFWESLSFRFLLKTWRRMC